MDIDKHIVESLQYLGLHFIAKDFQKNVITNYANGKDCFCVAGTGAGKSICYILCPLVMDLKIGLSFNHADHLDAKLFTTISIIVQPLKSLMKTQKNKLQQLGLQAIYVGDEDGDVQQIKKDICSRKYNYIILSPESATADWFIGALHDVRKDVAAIFVDESHCVKTM